MAERLSAHYRFSGAALDVDALLSIARPKATHEVWRRGEPIADGHVTRTAGVQIEIGQAVQLPAELRERLDDRVVGEDLRPGGPVGAEVAGVRDTDRRGLVEDPGRTLAAGELGRPATLVPLVAMTALTYNQAQTSLNNEIDQSLEQQALTSAEALDNAIQKAAQDTLLLTTNEFLFSQSVGIGTKQDFLNKHDGVWGYGDLAVFTTEGKLFAGTGETYTDQTTEA